MSGLMTMTVNEVRLFLRDPASAFFTVLFPTVLVVILGLIPGFREPNKSLGGLRVIDLYVPIAIALSLASEGVFDRVVATDVSLDALAVARLNASRLAGALRAPVEFRHGSLLAPISDVRAAVIVSNPPYIAYHEAAELPAGVRDWEPVLALLSGADGMTATAAIIRGAADLLQEGGILALEVDARRASLAAESLAVDPRYREISVRLDLAGRERFVIARRS